MANDRRSRGTGAIAGLVGTALIVAGVWAAHALGDDSSAQPKVSLPPPTVGSAHPGLAPSDRSPISLESLPLGPRTDVPWWQNGTLHIGRHTFATGLRLVVYRGGTTLIGRSGIDGADWYIVARGRLQPLVSSDGPLVPVVSSDGSRVAWVEEVGSTQINRYTWDVDYRVVEYDPHAREVLGSLDDAQRVHCCDAGGTLSILGITVDGRVLASSLGGTTVAWRPGHAPVRVNGRAVSRPAASQLEGNAWPGGVTWQGRGSTIFDTPAEYGRVDRNGAIHHVGAMPTDQTGAWSLDGTAYAYPGIAGGSSPGKVPLRRIWVRATTSPIPVELHVPRKPNVSIVAWESADAVIVEARQVFGRKGDYPPGLVSLLRCSATTGDCERVADSPTGNAVLPDAW